MSILKVNKILDKGDNVIISSDGSGNLTQSFAANTPAFSAVLTSNQTIGNSTNSLIAFDTANKKANDALKQGPPSLPSFPFSP